MNTGFFSDGRNWLSTRDQPRPQNIRDIDNRISAAEALRLCRDGISPHWQGDWPGLRQLLRAMDRRMPWRGGDFARWRQHQAWRSAVLGRVLVTLDDRLAPAVREACAQVYGEITGPALVSARELLGVLGAYEWRRQGIFVPGLGARIHPHYGVFPPTRHEYVDLVAEAEPPDGPAFDVGTGTGVLAAVLARRGLRVLATDIDPRAVACARDNMQRLGLGGQVEVTQADLFPAGRADLVVCNPPWLPGRVRGGLDRGVFDPGGRMLSAFLDRLARHLTPGGQGWLVLSDLAETLGLREPGALAAAIEANGLRVLGATSTRPRHPRATRATADPLRAARATEVITLWRLGVR
ncbi:MULTISPECIES: class I SAM-dependent methyltransferase [unclassified Crossiella]|uniref:methyltransferase n=1 Tax=unclassified Crossiella TaxID=2620835 RepID=UPI001FFF7679|nr:MULTISPECIES: class I SAM-dependent methyltransferase [unclassified Crossiella]MCK2239819.1 class I SAM-dependent methyltransferase [Crossiella sp. S99.2]MCK2252514.1 class I SAM-dependent methyltransferase [Crossiella sp. S99.1]